MFYKREWYKQKLMITDHHNKYNKNEKIWNIIKINKMWHQETQSEQMLLEIGADKLVQHEVGTDLQFV